jgi:DNA modification methylase
MGEVAGGGVVRVETIGRHTLYLGDCREVLPSLVNLDCVLVTDPPYPNGEGFFIDAIETARMFLAWVVPKAALVFWSELEHPPSRLPLCAVHIWHRTNVNGKPYEPIYHFAADGRKRRSEIVRHCVVDSSARTGCAESEDHPTQKPVAVMRWLLDKEPEGLVVDPFVGVGSTSVAAERAGRASIACEVNLGYFDIACRRVEQAVAQGKMDFGEEREKPVQETMEALETP